GFSAPFLELFSERRCSQHGCAVEKIELVWNQLECNAFPQQNTAKSFLFPRYLISTRRPTLTIVDGLAVGLLFSLVSRNGHRQRSIISALVRVRYYSSQFI